MGGRLLRDKDQGPLFQININDNLSFMQNELEKLKKQKAEKAKIEEEEKKNTVQVDNDEQLSVVDMTFEDINKVEMEERMQRVEELKMMQQQQIKFQQSQHLNGGGSDGSF